jgi:general secretion pathway protein I
MNRGFTLLEVMAAFAILSIALLVLIENQSSAMGSVLRVGNYERGIMIAENQLHWTCLDLNEAEDWQEYGELAGEDGDYAWSVLVEPLEMETQADARVVMLKLHASVSWPQGRGRNAVDLETLYLWGEE